MLERDKTILSMARKFLYSHIYLALQTAMAIYCFISNDISLPIIFFMSVMAISLLILDDLTVLFLPVALLSMAIMDNVGFSFKNIFENKPLLYALIASLSFLVISFILHFFIFKKSHPIKKFKTGKLLWANIAVAIALLLGGAVALGLKNYERLITLYYVLGLGVVMVLVYMLLRNYTRSYFNKTVGDVLARQMVYVCVMGIFMIAFTLIPILIEKGDNAQWYLPWKNGFSSMLLIAMPFAFYYSLKPKHGVIYWIIANLAFFAMFFSFSRGGMIFGLIEYFVCVIASIFLSKGANKIIYGVLTIVIIGCLTFYVLDDKRLLHWITNKITVDHEEARVKLFILAIENFLAHPIFGVGMGYVGEYFRPHESSLYWYHSTFFQVIGSMGLVGLIAYGYQFVVRFKILFTKRCLFNLFTAFAFFGYYMYQMVDVCEFVPLPWMLILAQIFVVCEYGNEDENVVSFNQELLSNKKYKRYKENRFI